MNVHLDYVCCLITEFCLNRLFSDNDTEKVKIVKST